MDALPCMKLYLNTLIKNKTESFLHSNHNTENAYTFSKKLYNYCMQVINHDKNI